MTIYETYHDHINGWHLQLREEGFFYVELERADGTVESLKCHTFKWASRFFWQKLRENRGE